MVRKAASIGQKWEKGYQEAVPDAVVEYKSELDAIADKVIAGKQNAIIAYTQSLQSSRFDSNVRKGLTQENAGEAYEERLTQIAANGFTDSQKQKIIENTKIRRALEAQYDEVIVAADGKAGNLKFPAGVNTVGLKKMILNQNVMKFVDYFSESSSALDIATVLKQMKTQLLNMEVA